MNKPALRSELLSGNPVAGSTAPGEPGPAEPAKPLGLMLFGLLGVRSPEKTGELGPSHSNFPPLATRIASNSSQILPVRNLRSRSCTFFRPGDNTIDRKSTPLNSSHQI